MNNKELEINDYETQSSLKKDCRIEISMTIFNIYVKNRFIHINDPNQVKIEGNIMS